MIDLDVKEKFLQAYDNYADALFRHSYFRLYNRELAKDLVQETFYKTWSWLAQGKEIKNLRAFLYRVLHNLIIDEVRKKRPLSLDELLASGWQAPADNQPTPEQAIDRQTISRLLDQLEETSREVVVMRFIDGLKPKEIANILEVSANVVSVRLNRALKQLRQLAGDKFNQSV